MIINHFPPGFCIWDFCYPLFQLILARIASMHVHFGWIQIIQLNICDCHQLKYIYRYDYSGLCERFSIYAYHHLHLYVYKYVPERYERLIQYRSHICRLLYLDLCTLWLMCIILFLERWIYRKYTSHNSPATKICLLS